MHTDRTDASPHSWDIFCRVVDNFGDIGVCWRLARILAHEHHIRVRLVTDRPDLLQRIAGEFPDSLQSSRDAAIRVVRWRSSIRPQRQTDAVIEAFACEIPKGYVDAMSKCAVPPLWINLEYLSAEGWVAECHQLPSRHPRSGLEKFFFFPGFDRRTGGLLRERDLITRRDAFRSDPSARSRFWRSADLPPPLAGERRVSLFGYENPAVATMLAHFAAGPHPTTVLVPEGRSVAGVAAWFGAADGGPGAVWQRGALCVRVLPFGDQRGYDHLLWACDLNLVRGEDSLVRALWAGRPLSWQLYRQDHDARVAKREAFLARLGEAFGDPPAAEAARALIRHWDEGGGGNPWPAYEQFAGRIAEGFERWCGQLADGPELAENLVQFVKVRLK